jgi:hypothetical protein
MVEMTVVQTVDSRAVQKVASRAGSMVAKTAEWKDGLFESTSTLYKDFEIL